MTQLNDTEELRQSLEKILELVLKTVQRLSTVLEDCSAQIADEDKRLTLVREKVRAQEEPAELKSGLTGRDGQDF